MDKIIKNTLLFGFIFIMGCEGRNNPFYPKAQVDITATSPVVTITYEIETTEEGVKVTSEYEYLTLVIRELYGGTYGMIDSVNISYFNPHPGIGDEIINSLNEYTVGFPVYVPPDSIIQASFNVVTDELEYIMAPVNGDDYEGPIGVRMHFYGHDGNNYIFEEEINITVQRYITDVP
jgi:hypothetical protein